MSRKKIKVPATNLSQEYKNLELEIDKAIKRVLNSGWYLMGDELGQFEEEFADFLGIKYVIGVSSGTDALTIALKSLDLKLGDEVIVPANVYPTIFGVNLSGLTIRLCDVDPKTLNISIKNIKKVWSSKVKVVVAVHLYGNPVDLDPIIKFCKEKNIFLVEDVAQAAGAYYKGKKVGSIGDLGCFSFYPTKNLGAYGDGGAISTDNKILAEKLKLWRMYGEESRYKSVLPGLNSRLSEIQAAVLRVKLPYLDNWNKKRIEIAKYYQKKLKDLSIKYVESVGNGIAVYHLMVVLTPQRDKLLKFLQNNGVGVSIHYPNPIHLTKTFSNLGKKGNFPVSEKVCNEVLSLPIYPQLKVEEIKYVTDLINDFFDRKG